MLQLKAREKNDDDKVDSFKRQESIINVEIIPSNSSNDSEGSAPHDIEKHHEIVPTLASTRETNIHATVPTQASTRETNIPAIVPTVALTRETNIPAIVPTLALPRDTNIPAIVPILALTRETNIPAIVPIWFNEVNLGEHKPFTKDDRNVTSQSNRNSNEIAFNKTASTVECLQNSIRGHYFFKQYLV
ncbi:unnamed protein product [Mytilus coruscus]|uniref:Uncharacterized protein n=1 Tax=Mytilus coruscus TaxID=42192 RepID=A0A6J8B2S1_MYTCO|nr:unnamed protein product [Mytilus coruscus]